MGLNPIEYVRGTASVDKDFRYHEVGNNNGDNHGVVLVDGVNAFEISIGECYGGKTSRWLYVDAVDINIFDGVEMTLPGLAR